MQKEIVVDRTKPLPHVKYIAAIYKYSRPYIHAAVLPKQFNFMTQRPPLLHRLWWMRMATCLKGLVRLRETLGPAHLPQWA